MEWNWLDAVLLGIVAVSVVAAMWEGLVREILSLGSLVVGVILAALEYPRVAVWLHDRTSSPEAAKCLAFLGLFLGTLIAGAVISFVLRKTLQKAGLAWFDRLLGAIFGLVRGFVIASVLLLAMVAFSIQTAALQGSMLAPYVITGARVVGALMPQDLSSQFQSGLAKFRRALIEKDKGSRGR